MRTRQTASVQISRVLREGEVSEAALRTRRRLLALIGGRIDTHARADGGLICEDRTSRARPRLWRIAPDGALRPDSSYSFARGAFVALPAPREMVR